MLWAAYGLLRDSGRVFLEAAPRELDPQRIGRALASEEGVIEVHDLHVWEVTTGMPAVSAHLIVGQDSDCHAARFRAARLLADDFGIEHSTLQVEHQHDEGELLQIDHQVAATSGRPHKSRLSIAPECGLVALAS